MTENELNLLHRYLDGAISSGDLELLEALLRNSAEARGMLRSLATVDAKWQQLAADEAFGRVHVPLTEVTRSVSEGLHGTASAENHSSLTRRVSPDTVGSVDPRRLMPLWLTVTVIATALVVGAFGWFQFPKEVLAENERGIARVIRIEGDGKAGEDRIVVDGTEVFAGEDLTMQQGLIELAFRETGVHVIATAPLRMKLVSNQRVSLHKGQVKLVVPPQGVGFVVDTAQRKFVDLGTSFVVTANLKGSEVLVLDGKISVDEHDGTSEDLMHEGEFARFARNGRIEKRTPSRLSRALPELSLPATQPGVSSLHGVILGFDSSTMITKDELNNDVIGQEFMPLIHSGFRDRACLEPFKQGKPTRFRGIAGAYHDFPDRAGLAPFAREGGWMVWYHGQVLPRSKTIPSFSLPGD